MFLPWKPPDFLHRSSHLTSSFNKQHSIYQTINSIISSLSKHTLSFVKNLRKTVSSFPQDLLSHSNFLQAFRDTLNITISIYESWLNNFSTYDSALYETQNKKYTEFQQSVLTLEKTILSESIVVDKAKNTFHLSAKKTENALYEMEVFKKKHNIVDNPNDNSLLKYKTNVNNLLAITKENENIYINKLTSLQIKVKQYDDAIQKYIMNTKALEINLNYHIKSVLCLYYNQTIALYENLQTNMKYGFEMASNLMKELTIATLPDDDDKNNNNNNNNSSSGNKSNNNNLEIKFDNFQYEPYEINCINNNKKDLDENMFTNIVTTLRSSLKEVTSNFNTHIVNNNNSKTNKNNNSNNNNNVSTNNDLNFINLLTIAIYHGECMNTKERRKLYKYVTQERKYRKKFLFTLNIQRSHGLLKLNFKKFHICGKVFYLILNCIEKENDFELFKFLLILSQTFYYLNSKLTTKNKKEFLQFKLLKHNLFRNSDFWRRFLIYNIDSTLSDINSDDSCNERMLQNAYFSQMIAVVNNMLEVELDKKHIYGIVNEMKGKYNVNNDIVDIINKLIEEKQYTTAQSSVKNIKDKDKDKEEDKKGERRVKSVERVRVSNKIKEEFDMEWNEDKE